MLNVDFYELFVRENCIDLVIDRFYRNTVWNTNVEWMISEVFKSVKILVNLTQEKIVLSFDVHFAFEHQFLDKN
jgi:hypothetical protein